MKSLKCKACGDSFNPSNRAEYLARKDYQGFAGELQYCTECANELFRDVIKTRPAKLYSAGAGCPLEPNDDSSPWQDNAIRSMED